VRVARVIRPRPLRAACDRLLAAAAAPAGRDEARDVEDPLHARLDVSPDADDEALWASSARRRASSSAPSTEESTNGRGREVDTMPPPALQRLVEALAQRWRGVDVVLSLRPRRPRRPRRCRRARSDWRSIAEQIPRWPLDNVTRVDTARRGEKPRGSTAPQAGPFAQTPGARAPPSGGRGSAAVRRPAAPCTAAALGPAPRARRGARLVGPCPAGIPRDPPATTCGAHPRTIRSSTSISRRHPRRRVRRRDHVDLGPAARTRRTSSATRR
jgi:hypothetical protein